MSDLPVNIDASYPDRSAGDTAHQQHHDAIHPVINALAGATPDPSTLGLATETYVDTAVANATSPMAYGQTLFSTTGYYLGPSGTSLTGAAFSVDFLRSVPFILPRSTSFDRIACNVTTAGAAGSVLRLGAYEANANGEPGALAFDAGTISAESTGSKEITIAETLGAGLYWLTVVVQGAGCSLSSITAAIWNLPSTTSMLGSGRGLRSTAASYSGALPASYGAHADQTSPPNITLRVA